MIPEMKLTPIYKPDIYKSNFPGDGYEDNISLKDIEKAVLVNELASENGMSLPEMAQRYLFSIDGATRVVMGARKFSQVTDTVSCWKLGALSISLFDEITQIILTG